MPKRGPSFHQRRTKTPGALRGEVLMDDKARRRVRQHKERKLLGVAFVIGLFASVIGLYLSPIFRVHNVTVTGATTLNAADVALLADVEGESLVSARFNDAQTRVAAVPQVKSVTIAKHWPDTIEIIIEERAPWATWYVGESPYTIDDTGIVLATQAANAGPVIHSPATEQALIPGDHVDVSALNLTHTLVEQVPAQLGVNLTQIEWTNDRGVTVTTESGYEVVFGDGNDVQYKLAVWKGIENEFGKDNMWGHVLDLRFGERPSFY